MHVRVNTVTGATDIEAGGGVRRDKAVPELMGARGFRGLTASTNRSTGEVGILGLWDHLQDLEASASAVGKIRDEVAAALGGSITTRIMEQVVGEVVGSAPAPGTALRIVSIKMDPARVDEHIEFFKADVLPEMRSTAGFVGVRNMIDRATGEGQVGTLWTDEAVMRASEARAVERQQQARARGVEIGDPSYREGLFTHLV